MSYAHRIIYFLCLCIGIVITTISIPKNAKILNLKEINIMNKNIIPQSGSFLTKDTVGNPLILEWEKIDPENSNLNQKIQLLSEPLVETYTQMELQFAKKHPDRISQEMFLKPLEPFFTKGIKSVDWELVEKQLINTFQQFFNSTDFAKYANQEEIQIFVEAKDAKTKNTLGMIQFLISPEYFGTKAALSGITREACNRGIGKLLMSSIFKLFPQTERIFLHTRITNSSAIELYNSWGFAKFPGKLEYWIDLEYLASESDILQKTAATISENK